MDGITGKTKEERIEIARKGGSVKSDAKKQAALLRSISYMKPETLEKKAWALIGDENLSAFEIERLILEMLKQELKTELRIKLIDMAIKAHQAIHGSKSRNLNVNIDTMTLWDRVKEKLKEENEQGNL